MRPAWTADVAALIASETPLRASHYVCGGERCSHRARANITTLGEDEPLSDDRGLPRHGASYGPWARAVRADAQSMNTAAGQFQPFAY